MGQAAAKGELDKLKDSAPELIDLIPELKDVTLKGVVPLNDELGRGAYGSVFTVKHGEVVCAAKKIHPILIDSFVSNKEKERIRDDFIRECLCCSSIRHPNIVQFKGVYYHSDQSSLPIMVMELMHTSLTKFVDSNKSNILFGKKISILHDASLGLNFLHSHKPQILHRDLSPNNVMLTSQLVAKIGDLGVAKVVRAGSEETKSKLQLTRAMPGTPDFMPPEVMEANAIYGTPIDVFSFGGIALYVFSEEWPTPSALKQKDPKTRKMVTLTETERRQKYLDKMTGEAVELRKMVEQCLDDDPDERPPIKEVSTIIEPLRVSILLYIQIIAIILYASHYIKNCKVTFYSHFTVVMLNNIIICTCIIATLHKNIHY